MSIQEITTTRLNPHVDPTLMVWEWEIPVYLFLGGLVAGMMIIAGINILRLAKGERAENFYSVQSPILGFLLMNIGMLALFMDLASRTGMKGIQEWLSFYFKAPQHAPEIYPEHDLFIQLMKLKNTLRHMKGEELITHLGLEYYD